MSEQSFRLIVDSIPGLVAIMTAEGELELVNRPVLDYFGRTLEELKGWGSSDAVHPDDLPQVAAAWKQSFETGEPYELRAPHPPRRRRLPLVPIARPADARRGRPHRPLVQPAHRHRRSETGGSEVAQDEEECGR